MKPKYKDNLKQKNDILMLIDILSEGFESKGNLGDDENGNGYGRDQMSHPMNQSVNDDRSVNSEDDTQDKLQTYWNEKFNFYKYELNKVLRDK